MLRFRPLRGGRLPRSFHSHGLQGDPPPSPDRLPHAGEPAPAGAGVPPPLGRRATSTGELRARGPGPPALDPPRRPALRERAHPHGDRAQQGPQGHRGEVPDDARPRCRLRARLGLPRTAHRAPGRQGARARPGRERRAPRDGSGREAPALPRLRAPVHRHPARGVPAARRLRRLGAAVPDDGARVPGDHRPRVRPLRRPGSRLQGAEARPLVHALQDGARPGGGRVRGAGDPVGLREVPARGAARPGSPAPRASRSSSGRRRPGPSRRTWPSR